MILLRSALYNAWFYAISVLLVLLCGLAALLPKTLAARTILAIAELWARLIVGALRPICGITVVVTGRENLPAGPALIASNHQSAFDTIVWLSLIHHPGYVMKKELSYIPLYGMITRLTGMIVVARDAGAAAIRALLSGAARVVGEGRSIVIFPEGTRVAPGQVGVLHPGIAALANHTGLPVVPVVTDSGTYWGRRTFRRYPGTITIAIKPALPIGLPRREMLARLAEIYAQGCG